MFKNFMILASVAGALTLSIAAPAAQAQGLNDDRSYEQYCRDLNADTGFSEAMGYAQQAEKEFQQASQYDELAANAEAYAKTSSSPADQAMWNRDAQDRRDQAKRLRDSANRNLERAKLSRAKFRINCDLNENSFAVLDEYVGVLIQSAEIAADPGKELVEEEKFERPKRKTAEKSPAENRKAVEKSAKTKRTAAVKKPKVKKQPRYQEQMNDEAAIIATNLALGLAGEVLHERATRKHHRNAMSENDGFENMGKMKKMKKMKKLRNIGGAGMVLNLGF